MCVSLFAWRSGTCGGTQRRRRRKRYRDSVEFILVQFSSVEGDTKLYPTPISEKNCTIEQYFYVTSCIYVDVVHNRAEHHARYYVPFSSFLPISNFLFYIYVLRATHNLYLKCIEMFKMYVVDYRVEGKRVK